MSRMGEAGTVNLPVRAWVGGESHHATAIRIHVVHGGRFSIGTAARQTATA
jgi:hypothetical protein